MTKWFQIIAFSFFAVLSIPAFALDHASKEEAIAMVKQGVSDLKDKGASIYADINDPKGKYTAKDLYLVVYDLTGRCLAHGQNAGLVGKDLSKLKDKDGKLFVQERVELARAKGTFWQEYKYTNPVTREIAPKETYCEKVNDVVVCGGIYK